MKKFKFYKQTQKQDCGPTCLRMISEYYGLNYSDSHYKHLINLSTEGASLYDLQEGAKKLGFEAVGIKINYEELINTISLPCILHWRKHHYVVLPPQQLKKKFKSLTLPEVYTR